jgi:uncharacterized protein (DUF58 family)
MRRGGLPQLTREGKFFLGITFGVGFAAIKTGNNLLFLVLGLLFSLLALNVILSEMTLRGLRVSRITPPHVQAGRNFLIKIELRNQKQRVSSFSIEVEDLVESKSLDKKCYFLKIPAQKTQQTSYKISFSRRGRYRFLGFRLATKFPFALYRASRIVPAPEDVLVYPRILDVGSLAATGKQRGEGSVGRVAGRGESLSGLRGFRDGDDLRDIHWKATARSGQLITKEHDASAAKHVQLLFDSALPADDDASRDEMERGVEIVASLVQHYLARGFSVSLVTRSARFGAGSGAAQSARLLLHVALLEFALPTPQPLRVHGAEGSGAFLVLHRRAPCRPRGRFAQVVEVGGALTEVRRGR